MSMDDIMNIIVYNSAYILVHNSAYLFNAKVWVRPKARLEMHMKMHISDLLIFGWMSSEKLNFTNIKCT